MQNYIRVAGKGIEIKFFTDEVNAFLEILHPAESKSLSTVEKIAAKSLKPIDSVGTAMGIIRSDVENGAKKASEDGSKEAFWKLGEKLSPLVAIEHGIIDHAENERGMEEYRAETRRQVAAILTSARN